MAVIKNPRKILSDSGLKKGQYIQPKSNIIWQENLGSNNEQTKIGRSPCSFKVTL